MAYLHALSVLFFLAQQHDAEIYGNNFTCDSFNECQDEILICDQGSDCNIQCGFENECCERATIHCPDNYKCNIICGGLRACSEMIIYGHSASILNVTGNGFGNDNFANTKTYCPTGGNCHIQCDSTFRACKLANISALHSNIMHLKCMNDNTDECTDVTAYCPLNQASNNCIFEGITDTSQMKNMNIYSTNGFSTVSIINHINSIGTMFCNPDYSSQCTIATDSHSCAAPETSCNTPQPTTSTPTNQMTTKPTTTSPSTSAPTTSSPTTASPITSAPTTLVPVTAAPITSAPFTSAPSTPAPVTLSPVTSSIVTSNPSYITPLSTGSTLSPMSADNEQSVEEQTTSHLQEEDHQDTNSKNNGLLMVTIIGIGIFVGVCLGCAIIWIRLRRMYTKRHNNNKHNVTNINFSGSDLHQNAHDRIPSHSNATELTKGSVSPPFHAANTPNLTTLNESMVTKGGNINIETFDLKKCVSTPNGNEITLHRNTIDSVQEGTNTDNTNVTYVDDEHTATDDDELYIQSGDEVTAGNDQYQTPGNA